MEPALLEYEKTNNKFIEAVKRAEFQDILTLHFLEEDLKAALLIPLSHSLLNVTISRTFVETHAILRNPQRLAEFTTVNGFKGAFAGQGWQSVHLEAKQDGTTAEGESAPRGCSVSVVGKGRMSIGSFSVIFAVIDRPLTYPGCAWEADVKEARGVPVMDVADILDPPKRSSSPARQSQTPPSHALLDTAVPDVPFSLGASVSQPVPMPLSSRQASLPEFQLGSLGLSPDTKRASVTRMHPPSVGSSGGSLENLSLIGTSSTSLVDLLGDGPPPPSDGASAADDAEFGDFHMAPLSKDAGNAAGARAEGIEGGSNGDQQRVAASAPTELPVEAAPGNDEQSAQGTAQTGSQREGKGSASQSSSSPAQSSVGSVASSSLASVSAITSRLGMLGNLLPLGRSAASPDAQQPRGESPANSDAPDGKSASGFSDFLERMRHQSSVGLVKQIRQFIAWYQAQVAGGASVDDLSKKVQSFLSKTIAQISNHQLYKNATQAELDNAAEGLEKYLMTKLYSVAFCPIASSDGEHDDVLRLRIERLASFVQPSHLDIDETVTACGEAPFLAAGQELGRLSEYKPPRDKLVCILNSCKILFEAIQRTRTAGADEFLPALIYVVLRANPNQLQSNINYIQRFRNAERMTGEAAYYFTMLVGAVSFLQRAGPDSLSIAPEVFEAEMAAAEARQATRRAGTQPQATAASVNGVTGAPGAASVTGVTAATVTNGATSTGAPRPPQPAWGGTPAAPQSQSQSRESDPGEAMDQRKTAELFQLLGIAHEPPVKRLLETPFDEMTVADLRALHAEYRRLATHNEQLVRTIALNLAL
eukprot:Opistho-1_new@101256